MTGKARCFIWLKAQLFKAIPSSIWKVTMFVVPVPGWWMDRAGSKQISGSENIKPDKEKEEAQVVLMVNKSLETLACNISSQMYKPRWILSILSDSGIRCTRENKWRACCLHVKIFLILKSNTFITKNWELQKSKTKKNYLWSYNTEINTLSPCYVFILQVFNKCTFKKQLRIL